MALQYVDKGAAGFNDLQARLYSEDWKILSNGLSGVDCVLVGCGVTAQGAPNNTVAVAKGAVLSNKILRAVSAGNVTMVAAHATLPRIDYVVADSSGNKQWRAGTAHATQPLPPTLTANDVVLAQVLVLPADTTIETDKLRDRRVMRENGPICIYKTTTREVTNTTAAAIHVLDKTNSGVNIPNGLFLTGRQLRVRWGGNMLLNSGTPTVTIAISFGGTTLWSDTTSAAAADADRGAWEVNFTLAAESNTVQRLAGVANAGLVTATKTAPVTGAAGDIGLNTYLDSPISGPATAGSIDADAANRVLAVTITLSVSNVANEVVTEYATVELI